MRRKRTRADRRRPATSSRRRPSLATRPRPIAACGRRPRRQRRRAPRAVAELHVRAADPAAQTRTRRRGTRERRSSIALAPLVVDVRLARRSPPAPPEWSARSDSRAAPRGSGVAARAAGDRTTHALSECATLDRHELLVEPQRKLLLLKLLLRSHPTRTSNQLLVCFPEIRIHVLVNPSGDFFLHDLIT